MHRCGSRIAFKLNNSFCPSLLRPPPPTCPLPLVRLEFSGLMPPPVQRMSPDCGLWSFTPFLAHFCPTSLPEHHSHYVSGETTHKATITVVINSRPSSPSLSSGPVPPVLGESSPLKETVPWMHLLPFIDTSPSLPYFRMTDRYLKAHKRRIAIKQYGS